MNPTDQPTKGQAMTQPTITDKAPAFFVADLARLNQILEPHLFTDPSDGWQGIDPTTAPSDALRVYGELASYGYANGWLA